MAPSRGKGKTKVHPLGSSSPAQGTRRTPRAAARGNYGGVPEVYRDLLLEASASNSEDVNFDRPLKKRKLTAPVSAKVPAKPHSLQTVEDSSASSDDSDESEFDFEDVDLEQPNISSPTGKYPQEDDIADVSIAIDSTKIPKLTPTSKRKAVTPAEKAHRLYVHKLHILCLLGHCMYVNTWCNDAIVHKHLLEVLPNKTRSYLKHNPEFSQFQQNRSFMDGLQQASEAWRGAFKITASGMRRARWIDSEITSLDSEIDPLDRGEFRRAAKQMEGSQDMGNQLFCSLLRTFGVDARVVCSLQVLPFGTGPKDKSSTPQKDAKKVVYAMASSMASPATDPNVEDTTMQNSSTVGKVPSARRRLGQPSFASAPLPAVSPPKRKSPIRKLTYPIFWVEAFNLAHQTWVPVDPLVTQTIGKASKLEPPGIHEWNQMSYVLAFERDGVARDVTKRYTKAYNAKTRRLRVESAEANGAVWLNKALRLFKRPRSDEVGRDKDQIEDSQLAQREAQEGLPNNVQDFKHHPYYSLERHLRRHEVIHPRREVGKVNAGTAAKPRMEVVFRRSDVQACKSAEKWFRVGREVKEGEQPLKRVLARRVKKMTRASEDDESEAEMTSALYAPFQTQLYVPPPVVKGKVPRNTYGNLDIYVPSMVPAGGVHIRHPVAKEAARSLRVDAVDAVTGFKFQGRQGTAVVEGVVIAEEFEDAVQAAIESLLDDQTEQEGMARSALALKMWRRFLTGLRIKERVSAYGDGNTAADDDEDMTDEEGGGSAGAGEGGFLAKDSVADERAEVLPTAGKFSLAELLDVTPRKITKAQRFRKKESEEADFSGRDSEDDDDVSESEPQARTTRQSRRTVVRDDTEDDDLLDHIEVSRRGDGVADVDGGGFLAEDDDMGGGFLPESEETVLNIVESSADISGGGDGYEVDVESQIATYIESADVADESNAEESHRENATEDDRDITMRDRSRSPATRHFELVWDSSKDLQDTNASVAKDIENNRAETTELPDATQERYTAVAQQSERQSQSLEDAEQHHWPEEANDESDHGSMLSHDPEDEDAEPDWLESD